MSPEQNLASAFAASFASQRLNELADPLIDLMQDRYPERKWIKKLAMNVLSVIWGAIAVCALKLRLMGEGPESTSCLLNYIITVLFVSGGTEGFNSLVKYAEHAKNNSKTPPTIGKLQG